eukprot:m.334846 g.334846  ORF g.334846 m.334846 type:complete len:140 (+) comp20516_c2_seq6:1514-1933(+)
MSPCVHTCTSTELASLRLLCVSESETTPNPRVDPMNVSDCVFEVLPGNNTTTMMVLKCPVFLGFNHLSGDYGVPQSKLPTGSNWTSQNRSISLRWSSNVLCLLLGMKLGAGSWELGDGSWEIVRNSVSSFRDPRMRTLD